MKKVKAECHSADRSFEITFDATRWFERASDEEIVRLAKSGWTGDHCADEVAIEMSSSYREIEKMLNYCHEKDMNHTVLINAKQAIAWIKEFREYLLDQIEGQK